MPVESHDKKTSAKDITDPVPARHKTSSWDNPEPGGIIDGLQYMGRGAVKGALLGTGLMSTIIPAGLYLTTKNKKHTLEAILNAHKYAPIPSALGGAYYGLVESSRNAQRLKRLEKESANGQRDR